MILTILAGGDKIDLMTERIARLEAAGRDALAPAAEPGGALYLERKAPGATFALKLPV